MVGCSKRSPPGLGPSCTVEELRLWFVIVNSYRVNKPRGHNGKWTHLSLTNFNGGRKACIRSPGLATMTESMGFW
jgi:hypothetical protein